MNELREESSARNRTWVLLELKYRNLNSIPATDTCFPLLYFNPLAEVGGRRGNVET